MAKYTYAKQRRHVNYKGFAAIILIISVALAGGMTARGFFITKAIKNAEKSIADVEKEKITLEEHFSILEEEATKLEEQVNELEEVLWRYEPVIIPDSMKE